MANTSAQVWTVEEETVPEEKVNKKSKKVASG